MSLVYITGVSGVGKSTIKDALKHKGYDAYDTDENDLTTWVNKHTGLAAQRADRIEDQTAEFLNNHDWIMDRAKVIKLKTNFDGGIVFLCGVTSNDTDLIDLFDQTICLTIEESILRQRLASRTSNDFGKSDDELSNILSWHKLHEKKYQELGAKMIDASQPIEAVVDEIISFVEE